MTDRPRLIDAGIPYVTLAAAQSAVDVLGVSGVGDAQRKLTALLADANQTSAAEGGRPAAYRARSRSHGWDVTARVSIEPPLAVVVAVSVRRY